MLSLIAISSLLVALIMLITLAVVDLRTWLLPNKYVLIVFILGFVFHGATQFALISYIDTLLGGLVGGGLLYSVHYLAERFYKPDALGLGDVKLMGAAGIWLGPHYILFALIIGAMAGIVHGLGLAVWRRDFNFNTLQLPAGPGFIIGILVTALYAFKDLPAIILP